MRILMTMFGWNDGGGGTILPRQLALELRARGHEVLVFHAATGALPGGRPYALHEQEDGGVRVVGLHHRPTTFLDDRAPARELHDPEAVRRFRTVFDAFAPEFVHYHNFLGLSAGITDVVAAKGVPSCYTPYNFWPVCPTLYLTLPDLSVCGGVAQDGANCLCCTRSTEPGGSFVARRDRLREALGGNVGRCLATSGSVRDVLLANGYAPSWVQVLPLANGRADRIWREVGATRPDTVGAPLRLGFVGSVLPIKGVHTLVAAAQRLRGAFEVVVHGDGPPDYVASLRRLDRRELVRFRGGFGDAAQPGLLAELDVGVVPSVCLDHSPLVVGELQAARVPVVGARIGGIPEYVQAGAGELFPSGDDAALAAVLQRLVDAPATVREWRRRIAPPPPFAAYVGALEAHYRAAVAAATTRAPQAEKELLRLNLGCGGRRRDGWLNVDKVAAAAPDQVVDLERLPWPFADDSAGEVLLEHVLEHLGRDQDTFLGILRELWRVCAPGASVRIVVPHPRHQDFLQDPTHVRPIVPELFQHLSLATNRDWQARGLPGTPLARYLGIDFEIVAVTQRLDPVWQRWLDADPARQREIDHVARSYNNVVQEVEIVLRAIKPFAG